jgi:hypothetical protein
VVLQFLADQASDQVAVAIAGWLGRSMDLATEQELRGRVLALNEILGLEWEYIQRFYVNKQAQQQGDQPGAG